MRSFRLHWLASVGVLVALVGAPVRLGAQNYFEGTVRLNNAGNTLYNGVHVGPYNAAMPGQPSIDFFCVDFLNASAVGVPWTARFTRLSEFFGSDAANALSRTRWGQYWGNPAAAMYQRGAWLATQFALNSKGSGNSTWGGIHGAIWDAFTPGTNPNWSARVPWMNGANTAAAGGFQGMNWNDWYVVTDVRTVNGLQGRQEYIVQVTPEPETVLLMATGLVALALAVARQRGSFV